MRSPYKAIDQSYPANGDQIVAEALQDLYYDDLVVAEGRNARELPEEALIVKHTPLGVYSPPPKEGGLPADFVHHARPQRWRYIVVSSKDMSSDNLILTVDLLPAFQSQTSPEVSHIEQGTSVVKLREVLREVSNRPPQDLRIFEAPSVYLSALWVHGEIQKDAPQRQPDLFIDMEEKLKWAAPQFVAKVNEALASKRPSQGRVLRKASSTA